MFSRFFKQIDVPDTVNPVDLRTRLQDMESDSITEYELNFQGSEKSRDSAYGKKQDFLELSDEIVITESMGGKVKELILQSRGREFNCIGRGDGHSETVGKWYGFEHKHGLPDRNGKIWWVYQKCTRNDYNIAWWKVIRLLKKTKSLGLEKSITEGGSKREFQPFLKNPILLATQNYYQILATSMDASLEEIKKNYRVLAKRFHPDTSKYEKEIILEYIKVINVAFEVLSDPSQRSQYDKSIMRFQE